MGMLIIGHRGAKGLRPENTIGSIREAVKLGVDIVEFDVHITKDKVPILIHDRSLLRTHHKLSIVSKSYYKDLLDLTKDGEKRITSLEEVLDEFFGKVTLNIEIKRFRAAKVVMELLLNGYVKKTRDWDNLIISSFKPTALMVVRNYSKRVRLALLSYQNPFLFIAVAKFLKLYAVGFYNLYLDNLALKIAKGKFFDLFVYVHTVNSVNAARALEARGIKAIVTNYPDRFVDYPRN